jgi:hypothetical protein
VLALIAAPKILLVLILAGLAACARRSPQPMPCALPDLSALPNQGAGTPPLWGQFLTKVDFLDPEGAHAETRPLSEAGSLEGPWINGSPDTPLRVERFDPTGGNEIGRQIFGTAAEYFQLVVVAGDCKAEYPFRAAFGAFRLSALDFDGDGVREAVLERGDAGPNPYSYRRRLEILRLLVGADAAPAPCRFEPIFDTPLNGLGAAYVNVQEAGVVFPMPVPHTWVRRYRFLPPDDEGLVGIELCTVKGDGRQARVASTDWGMAMQLPRLKYRYRPSLGVFELQSFEFRDLDGSDTGAGSR